jgi:hypothetical protein
VTFNKITAAIGYEDFRSFPLSIPNRRALCSGAARSSPSPPGSSPSSPRSSLAPGPAGPAPFQPFCSDAPSSLLLPRRGSGASSQHGRPHELPADDGKELLCRVQAPRGRWQGAAVQGCELPLRPSLLLPRRGGGASSPRAASIWLVPPWICEFESQAGPPEPVLDSHAGRRSSCLPRRGDRRGTAASNGAATRGQKCCSPLALHDARLSSVGICIRQSLHQIA